MSGLRFIGEQWEIDFMKDWCDGKFLTTHKMLKAIFGDKSIDDAKIVKRIRKIIRSELAEFARKVRVEKDTFGWIAKTPEEEEYVKGYEKAIDEQDLKIKQALLNYKHETNP